MKRQVFSLFVFFGLVMTALVSVRAQDYAVDASFNPAFGGQTSNFQFNNVVVVQPDQKILVGGNFTTVNETSSPLIVRLNADGSRDTAFNSPMTTTANDVVFSIKLLPDGKMLVSGVFRINGAQTYLVRLNADGTVDNSFSTALYGGVYDLETYADGKFLVCGWFSVDGSESRVARLNADGSKDTSFQVNVPGDLTGNGCRDVIFAPDGKIFAGGAIQGNNVRALVKLNADGSRDTTFVPQSQNPNLTLSEIHRLVLQPDGNVIASYTGYVDVATHTGVNRYSPTGIVQNFSNCNNVGSSPSEFLYLQNDGRIITSECRSQATFYRFARLLADGTADTGLNSISFGGFAPRGIDRQADGKYLVVGYFSSVDGVPRQRIARLAQNLESNRRRFDFDGDGKADVSVFRPSVGTWYISNSSNNSPSGRQFGIAADKLAPADFDGDGKTDISVFRDGYWYRINSLNNVYVPYQFGSTGDKPVPADFDGDGKADYSVFRSSIGTWYRLNSSTNQVVAQQFGTNGDLPQIADFDGDGKSDTTVFRPSTGVWYALFSTNNAFFGIQFGTSEDVPTPADFDGDGKTDVAVFRPSTGIWYRTNSLNNSFAGQQFGTMGDVPTAADYDGDGRADLAVFRQGIWYLQQTTAGFAAQQFGTNGDIPVPSAFGQ